MNESINEMNSTYSKVYSEFNNIAKYFLDNDTNQSIIIRNYQNEEQINLSNFHSNNINTLKSNNNSNLQINNTEIIQEESEIFYGTQEDEAPSQNNVSISFKID